jgi:hypothetical protein
MGLGRSGGRRADPAVDESCSPADHVLSRGPGHGDWAPAFGARDCEQAPVGHPSLVVVGRVLRDPQLPAHDFTQRKVRADRNLSELLLDLWAHAERNGDGHGRMTRLRPLITAFRSIEANRGGTPAMSENDEGRRGRTHYLFSFFSRQKLREFRLPAAAAAADHRERRWWKRSINRTHSQLKLRGQDIRGQCRGRAAADRPSILPIGSRRALSPPRLGRRPRNGLRGQGVRFYDVGGGISVATMSTSRSRSFGHSRTMGLVR